MTLTQDLQAVAAELDQIAADIAAAEINGFGNAVRFVADKLRALKQADLPSVLPTPAQAEPASKPEVVAWMWRMHGWAVTAHSKNRAIKTFTDVSRPPISTTESPDFIDLIPLTRLDTSSKAEAGEAAAHGLAARDREADRQRFPDPNFNRWLDESVTDTGEFSVWNLIDDVCAAWHGWENALTYAAPVPAQPAPTSEAALEPQGCMRSHPHENMDAECERKTVGARAANAERCKELRDLEIRPGSLDWMIGRDAEQPGGILYESFAAQPAPSSEAAQEPSELQTVVDFLLGAGPLDGLWFGDSDTERPRARYWWREHLRKAFAAAAQPAPARDDVLAGALIRDLEFAIAIAGRTYPERAEAISLNLSQYRALQSQPAAQVTAPGVMPVPVPERLEQCPITGKKFWGNLSHPELGDVPTYGGPFDTYTIPTIGEDDELRSEHYDHDRGEWIEGGAPVGWFYVDQQPEIGVQVTDQAKDQAKDAAVRSPVWRSRSTDLTWSRAT